MRKRSILLVAGALAILATLVVGPATAGSERASAGNRGHRPRPGAADAQERLGGQQPHGDRARHEQHLFRRRDLRRKRQADSPAVHGAAEAGEAEARHRHVHVQAVGGVE